MEETFEQTLTTSRKAKPSGRDQAARLRIIYPPSMVCILPLENETMVLGRQPDAESSTPALAEPTVSRRHFSIEPTRGGGYLGRDLESRDGSWVDAEAVGAEPVELPNNTVLRLGDVIGVVEIGLGALQGATHRCLRREQLRVRATAKHFGRDRRQTYRWLDSFGLPRGDPSTTEPPTSRSVEDR